MKILLSFSLLFFSLNVFCQSKIDQILQISPTKVDKYEINSLDEAQCSLKMNYGSPIILNPQAIKEEFKGKRIEKIELIYTDFSRAKIFNQPKLNRKRLQELKKLDPALFKDETINWIPIAQTDLKSATQGADMFHGFVITFSTREGTSKLEELIYSEALPDSTVLKIFDRHKNWKNLLVVADLTGSMSPYTAQVMVWLRLNAAKKKAAHFTFFNDGDTKATSEKAIGKTGGIYQSNADDFNKVLDLALLTMENGYGGDEMENDIEAIIAGLDQCKNCTDVVLIADNNANMRDFELIKQINKPVKVVICGSVNNWVNPQYLNLARDTKGSVHTIETDLIDLIKVNEGERIKIGMHEYIIKDGQFIEFERL